MVDSSIFIGTIVIAVVQFLKYFVPAIAGAVTIIVAGLIGLLVAAVDTHIGIANITIAQGILIGLSASGAVALATKVSQGTNTPTNTTLGK